MKAVSQLLLSALVQVVLLGLLLFLPAGTFAYWQAWVLLAVALSTWIPGIYLLRTNPAAVQRRMRGGPTAETRGVQRLVMAGVWLSLLTMVVISVLDHRFGWSSVPAAVCVIGDVVVAGGLAVAMMVVIQNSYASATVRVEADQQLVSTGLYGLVRHPMYTGNLLLMIGVPLALGSYWGLVFVLPGLTVLGLRIRDEERLLADKLAGYRAYTQQVRYRLVPLMW